MLYNLCLVQEPSGLAVRSTGLRSDINGRVFGGSHAGLTGWGGVFARGLRSLLVKVPREDGDRSF
jgi:hypothetical protein